MCRSPLEGISRRDFVARATCTVSASMLADTGAMAQQQNVAVPAADKALIASLAENCFHVPMHPADEFAAFARLLAQGKSVEDVAAAYLAAHATVVASIEPEAFGRTAVEAAAMGCPVIATAIGAPPETVLAEPVVAGDAITGWLVPPHDAEALAKRLAEVLALGPAERSAMAARARAHVLGQFTVGAMQRRTLAVYDRLLGTVLERRFTESSGQPDASRSFPRQS